MKWKVTMDINGSIEGLKNSVIEALEDLYDLDIPQDKLWTEELINRLSEISGSINREIAVYVDRKGRITDVCVGDFKTVCLNEAGGRRSKYRLSGVRSTRIPMKVACFRLWHGSAMSRYAHSP